MAEESWRTHSRLFLACGVMILSPFQYGIDFGLIGELRCSHVLLNDYHTDMAKAAYKLWSDFSRYISSPSSYWTFRLNQRTDLRLPLRSPQMPHRMESSPRKTTAHLFPHDSRSIHQFSFRRCRREQARATGMHMGSLRYLLYRQHHHDVYYPHWRSLRRPSCHWIGQRLFHDFFSALYTGEQHGSVSRAVSYWFPVLHFFCE
jgi:hypothetical protein